MAAKAVDPRLKRFALHLQIHAFSISAVILAQSVCVQQMLCPLTVSSSQLFLCDSQEYLTNFEELLLTSSGLDLQPYSAERMLAGIQHPMLLLSAA